MIINEGLHHITKKRQAEIVYDLLLRMIRKSSASGVKIVHYSSNSNNKSAMNVELGYYLLDTFIRHTCNNILVSEMLTKDACITLLHYIHSFDTHMLLVFIRKFKPQPFNDSCFTVT